MATSQWRYDDGKGPGAGWLSNGNARKAEMQALDEYYANNGLSGDSVRSSLANQTAGVMTPEQRQKLIDNVMGGFASGQSGYASSEMGIDNAMREAWGLMHSS